MALAQNTTAETPYSPREQEQPNTTPAIVLHQPRPYHKLKAQLFQCRRCNNLHAEHTSFFFSRTTSIDDFPKSSKPSCMFCKLAVDAVSLISPEAYKHNNTPVCIEFHYGSSVSIIIPPFGLSLEVFTLPDQPAPWDHVPELLTTPGDTSSDASFRQAQKWLRTCIETHDRCGLTTPVLPRRVIDVHPPGPHQSDGSIRLLETQKETGQYLCLSHCWGGQSVQPLTTTCSNLSTWTKNIPWQLLPKTFQDAVTFVRRLGQRYIWIDSLCIIQDDEEDWRRESAKMSTIYQNSYLTLAATKSKNSTEGLFSVQDPRCNQRVFRGVGRKGSPFTLYCRQKLPHWEDGAEYLDPGSYYNSHFPLLRRGWVYQERLLSPRVLHFGAHELLWECMGETCCECGHRRGLSYSNRTKFDHDEMFNRTNSRSSVTDPWWKMVEQFSALKLTKQSDRLPAMSGLARQMQSLSNDTYIAGLWRGSLVKDLVWACECKAKGHRVLDSGVPTWSWARLGCQVRRQYCYDTSATIYDVDISYVGDDPYGEVSSGSIKLSGLIASATLKYNPSTFSTYNLIMERGGNEVELTYPDYDYSVSSGAFLGEGERLYCIRMSELRSGNGSWLVLRCVDERESTFERVGMTEGRIPLPKNSPAGSSIYHDDLTKDCEERIVTLV